MTTEQLSSTADVTTDRPERYGSQLVKHFGNKIEASWADGRGTIRFAPRIDGSAELWAEPGVLHMRVSAPDQGQLTRLEEVVASHLVRFGQRDELTVQWQGP